MDKKTSNLLILTIFLIGIFGTCFVFADGVLEGKETVSETTHTRTTDTICKNGACNKVLYSGVRNVYEDETWKRVEDARSLKEAWDIIFLENDSDFIYSDLDYNYTSIWGNLSFDGNWQDYPEFCYEKPTGDVSCTFKLEEKYQVRNTTNRDYEELELEYEYEWEYEDGIVTSDKKEFKIEGNPLGKKFKFGGNSTTITLEEPDTEILEDGTFDEDTTRDGSGNGLFLDYLDGSGEIAFIKFNISIIPNDSIIINASLTYYLGWGSVDTYDIWYSSNKSWVEDTIDGLCGDGVYCDNLSSFFTTKLKEGLVGNGTDFYFETITDLHSAVQTELDAGNSNLTFIFNHTDSNSAYYEISSKEYPTAAYRPYLNITYTEADTTKPTYSLNQTNNTLASQTTLFSIQYNDDTALHPKGQYIFSTNNTGTWTNESAVNFTGTPSWANATKTLNSTEGISIGYRWYADDNAGNINNTEIFTLTTTSEEVNVSSHFYLTNSHFKLNNEHLRIR